MSCLETLNELSSKELCAVPLEVKQHCENKCNACPADEELIETLIPHTHHSEEDS